MKATRDQIQLFIHLDHINASLTWICFGKIFNCDLWPGLLMVGLMDSGRPFPDKLQQRRSVLLPSLVGSFRIDHLLLNSTKDNAMQYDANIQSRQQQNTKGVVGSLALA